MVERAVAGDGAGTAVAISLGSTVCCRDADGEHHYTLVCPGDANPLEGRISVASPVGRALLGRAGGEEVDVATPGGVRPLTILSFRGGEVF
ncbi:MAG TPA: GreA/GreB family elongation factor [Candidatus Dormibacteraeota bacterium]|jgi:transcription elongation GreA/GreB family factor